MLVDDGARRRHHAGPRATRCSARGVQRSRDVELRGENEDFRPASVLEDVVGPNSHRKLPRAANIPAIALGKVKDFSLVRTKAVPDTNLENTQQTTL